MQIPYGEETTSSTEATGKFEQSPPSWPPEGGGQQATISHLEKKNQVVSYHSEKPHPKRTEHTSSTFWRRSGLFEHAWNHLEGSFQAKREHIEQNFFPPTRNSVSHQRETEVGCTGADNFGSKIWSILPTAQGKHVFYLCIFESMG